MRQAFQTERCIRRISRSALDRQLVLYAFRSAGCSAALLRLASEAQSRSGFARGKIKVNQGKLSQNFDGINQVDRWIAL
jgi:hypothetical protein